MVLNTRIDNRYEIREVLGKGGMGIVYKAYDDQRRGFVALKTIRDGADPVALQLFVQEWTTLANISHPNIVDMLHAGEFEEDYQRKPYFVMPLLNGQTLEALIRDSARRPTVELIVDLLHQTCRGLDAAHSVGLIHRDLKPSNLFVINGNALKIIDFGMVHLMNSQRSVSGLKGTLQYMSPEQLDGKDLTPATDIFSLGVVAYEAFTGRKPFDRGSENAIKHAIRNEFLAPVSEANPAVNKQLARVIAKALAKNPWNRFGSASEFGEYLQRSVRGESIDLFDPAKTKPRTERARKALNDGDYEFAQEILDELQSEGHLDSEITLLAEKVKLAVRNRGIQKILESARTRLKEGEYAIAWQKVQEALHREPGNTEAQALQAEIETRRNDQKIEQWRCLVAQHLHNHAFSQARQAIEEIRKLKPDAAEVLALTADVDRRERQFRKLCEEKERDYESALASYRNGEVSAALSKLKRIIDPDSPDAGLVEPERDQLFRETYNKIRIEWEEAQLVLAEINKAIEAGTLTRAEELATQALIRNPNDFTLQALKLKIEDLLRQEKSAYIADISRQVDTEPDLDRAVQLLEEALGKYPGEAHFRELAGSLRRRRDLVNSIAAKARQCEEQNLAAEALAQWNTLRSIHPRYPGLNFEIERVQRRNEQQRREEAKLNWVDQVDQLLQNGEHDRARGAAEKALLDFPDDAELLSLKRLAIEAQERGLQAVDYCQKAEDLSAREHFSEAIELLRQATELDPHNASVRNSLANTLAGQARVLHAADWRSAESLIEEALSINPNHALAKSLRPSVLLSKRLEFVDGCLAQARELQAKGENHKALVKVQEGLTTYPNDARLLQLIATLRHAITEQNSLRRNRDLEEMRRLTREAQRAVSPEELTSLLERSATLSGKYADDLDFSVMNSEIHQRATDAPSRPAKSLSGKQAASPLETISKQPEKRQGERQSLGAWLLVAGATTRFWMRLRRGILPLQPKSPVSALTTVWNSIIAGNSRRISGLTALQRLGLALGVILASTLAVVFWPGNQKPITPHPLPTFAVSFDGDIDGAKILLGDRLLASNLIHLSPGSYTITVTKPGYKPLAKRFTVESQPTVVDLNLEPEPQVIRIAADVPTGQILLDGHEIGVLQEGNFTYNLPNGGSHTLELVQNRLPAFTVHFQADTGRAARLSGPVVSQKVPVLVVSNLGAHAIVYASEKGAKANLKNEEPQVIPPDGRELTLSGAVNELTYNDDTNSLVLPIESGNAPILVIRAGTAPKGTLLVETNIPEATVFINGQKKRRGIQQGKWIAQLDPADYRVRVAQEGYDEVPEQQLTIVAGKKAAAKFELKPAVKSAFLRIEGGTPDAAVSVDDHSIGSLDANGALGPVPISSDTDHLIRLQKDDHEPSEVRRKASVRDTILISGSQARLKPFGAITFELDPLETRVTIHRQGEPARVVNGKSVSVPEGTYAITGTADQYETQEISRVVASGKSTAIQLKLSKRVATVAKPNVSGVNQLFDHPDLWKQRDDGFWVHDGTAWLKEGTFRHTFEFSKVKKSFNRQEKVGWRIYFQGLDYFECEIDGSNYSRREVVAGRAGEWVRHPHRLQQKNSYPLTIKVDATGFSIQVGQASDALARPIEGRTALDGKVALRLIE